jgi:hypothetical protein
MQLVVQYGYIVLFSEVFPLASAMSFIQNTITISSQVNNFSYARRFKAEVSNGIGSFVSCLEILTKLSVMTNCMTIFFTSSTFQKIYVEGDASSVTKWSYAKFLIIVLVTEHVLMII